MCRQIERQSQKLNHCHCGCRFTSHTQSKAGAETERDREREGSRTRQVEKEGYRAGKGDNTKLNHSECFGGQRLKLKLLLGNDLQFV